MPRTLPCFAALLFLALVFPSFSSAEERNGVLLNVSKRTLNRADRRDVYYTRYDRTQGYKVTLKNTSLKALPEGEVQWTILVVKAAYGGTEKYTGKEKLKPLLPSETVELMVGAVPVGGYRIDRDYKDEMEHEIVVTHNGKETIRASSKPAFAALARNATLMTPEEEPEAVPGEAPAAATATPKPASPAAMPPSLPGSPGAPAAPPTASPTPAGAQPQPPPVAGQSQPYVDPSDTQPFDFFNLNKKKPAPAPAPAPQ